VWNLRVNIGSENNQTSFWIVKSMIWAPYARIKVFVRATVVGLVFTGSFDIRRFHQAVLGSGYMPLVLLEEHIDWFIERTRKGS